MDFILTDEEIAYLEAPYLPHPLAGVMAQNKPANAGKNRCGPRGTRRSTDSGDDATSRKILRKVVGNGYHGFSEVGKGTLFPQIHRLQQFYQGSSPS